MKVEELGVRGTNSIFRVAGVDIVITRRWGAVLAEYIGISTILTVAAISTLFLLQSSSRATVVASMILSKVFVIITANTYTPKTERRLHLRHLCLDLPRTHVPVI